MTSGYVYEPLRAVRDPESSVEMHIVDQYLNNSFDFDEYVRVCAAASHADAIEVSALSDLLRQYLLASVIKPKQKTKISEEEVDESVEASEDQSEDLSTSVGDGSVTARKKWTETKFREPDLTMVNIALQNMIRVLIDDINNVIVTDVGTKDVQQITEELNRVYARLGAMAYAHHLISNDTALMPSDNTYTIDGLKVRVSRASKLFEYIFKKLKLTVPIEQLLDFEIPRLDPIKQPNKQEYIENFKLMVKVLEELYDDIVTSNKALTLTPALGVVTKTYMTKWEELGVVGKISQWFVEKMQRLDTPKASIEPVVKDKTYDTVVDLKDVAARVSRQDNVTKTFLEASGIRIEDRRDVLEKYNNDVLTLEPDEFFRRLLEGNYTLNTLKTDATIDRMEIIQRQEDLQVRVSDVKVKLNDSVTVEARCVFVPVAEYLSQLVPSIMALSYPLYQTMTAPYSLKSTELVGSLNTSDGDINNDELLANFIEHLASLKAGTPPPESATEAEKKAYMSKVRDERFLLLAEKTAIYGDSEDAFKPRAGRVAHQWDSLYFHLVEKYGHGQLEDEKDAYDWLGFVVFKDPKAMEIITGGNKHRFYTIHDNLSVVLPLSGKGRREREQQRTRNDNTRFNVNMLRERIIAEGAIQAFAKDTSRNKKNYKIWLSSIPDNTSIEFRPPQPPTSSDDSEATTELFSAIANFSVALGTKAFKYVFSSFYNATPADVPVLVASETKQIAKQHRAHFVEKYAKAMPITDIATSLSLTSEERIRRDYHTEYVLFHNTGMTLREIEDYAKYLKATTPAKKAAKKPGKAATAQAKGEESLLDADAAEIIDEMDNPKPSNKKKKNETPITSTPAENIDAEGDFDD